MCRGRTLGYLGIQFFLILAASNAGWAQEPAAPAPPVEPSTNSAPAAAPKPGNNGYSHASGFLLRGTIFNDKAKAFPSIELRVRRAGEKKFHWQSFTNSRGEFAMRVPNGAEYEMVVSARGFRDQVKRIEAKSGVSEETFTFRMERVTGAK